MCALGVGAYKVSDYVKVEVNFKPATAEFHRIKKLIPPLSATITTLAMPFAQLIIGPPGSGKSTYCDGMHQFLSAIGRKSSVVNLDPANDRTSYPCAVDVRDLVTLEKIMADDELGPNGGVLYALEELEENWEWLEGRLKGLGGE